MISNNSNNLNGVLFPRKINNKNVMMNGPSDNGHTPFGDLFMSQSPDIKYWGEQRRVMAPTKPWEKTKIGAGPIPIETDRGWFIFYHGVLTSCNGFVYSWSAALLDNDEPWKVLKRGCSYLLSRQRDYELVGDTDAVVFTCANLVDADTGRNLHLFMDVQIQAQVLLSQLLMLSLNSLTKTLKFK